MLRITVNKGETTETWELEGKLSGEWVRELERYWKESNIQNGTSVELDLKSVSYVDSAGKQLLRDMYKQGVRIKGRGCMAKAVVEEVVRAIGRTFTPINRFMLSRLIRGQ